jgi:phosphomannomutase
MSNKVGLPDVIASSSGLRTRMDIKDGTKLFFRLGTAIGRKFEGDFVLGHDTRPSSEPFAEALASGLDSTGMSVTICGVCPVQVVSYLVSARATNFGLMVTASHNPPEWNGLKVFDATGVIVDESTISSLAAQAFQSDESPSLKRFDRAADLQEVYVRGLMSELGELRFKCDGVKIAIDPGNGASSRLSQTVLEMVGADVTMINSETDGSFRRVIEPRVDTLSKLGEVVRSNKCDFGIGYDADGDRAALSNERGEIQREDMTLLASLRQLLKRLSSPFVVNHASSSAFADLSAVTGRRLYLSKVGERNVVMRMRETGAVLGGEGSCGGVIYTKLAATRDGILATVATASLIRETGNISDVLGPYSRYHQYRQNVPYDSASISEDRLFYQLKGVFPDTEYEDWDGLKFHESDGWILIRRSRTEPVIRVMAEASSEDRARSLALKYAAVLRRIMG